MTRSQIAGKRMGEAIIEMIHLMYQNKTAMYFLKALIKTLTDEADKRKND